MIEWKTKTHHGFWLGAKPWKELINLIPTVECKHDRWVEGVEVILALPWLFSHEECWRATRGRLYPPGYEGSESHAILEESIVRFEMANKNKWEVKAYAKVSTGYELSLVRVWDKIRTQVVVNRIPDVIISFNDALKIQVA